jgi:hypothetical protein
MLARSTTFSGPGPPWPTSVPSLLRLEPLPVRVTAPLSCPSHDRYYRRNGSMKEDCRDLVQRVITAVPEWSGSGTNLHLASLQNW